jgi:hypothetical protein
VLATFSLCDEISYEAFGSEMQTLTEKFIRTKENYGMLIDSAVSESALLKNSCYHKF